MIEVREGVSPERAAGLEAVVASQKTLEDVVRWALSQTPSWHMADVVVQDEYTHDVVVRVDEGVYLVYDTT